MSDHGNGVDRRGDWCATATGRQVWPLDARVEDVCFDDIALSLSKMGRFNGHVKRGVWHYSIAQHSVIVSHACKPEHALIGLLHDAAEYVRQDIVRPFKRSLGAEYHATEAAWHRVIGLRFGLGGDVLVNPPHDVRVADEMCLAAERRDIVDHMDRDWNLRYGPLAETVVPWDARTAYTLFCRRFYALYSEPAGAQRAALPGVVNGSEHP